MVVLAQRTRGTANPESKNGTSSVGWVSDPNGRGTVTLLTSCLLTLGLCVWSAMHLNIPPRRMPALQLGLLYLKWSLIGVLGPELVVFTAWRQLNSARALRKEVQKSMATQDSKQSGSNYKVDVRSKHPQSWTIVHGFYAGMGGFAFDFEFDRPSDLAHCLPDLRRLTLTARGVSLLAKCGCLPNVSKEEIEDKSKADHLAKTLICVQAAWLLVQVFGRVAQKLPVTLLEVNTLAHVMCTFIIYLLWWNKPSMIYEPTHLKGDWVPAMCAYMYMSSQISIWERDRPTMRRRAWLDSELSALVYVLQTPEAPQSTPPNDMNDLPFRSLGELRPRQIVSDTPTSNGTNLLISKASEKVKVATVSDIKRWQLATRAIEQYPAIASRLKDSGETPQVFEPFTEELVTEHSTNWPTEDLLRGTGGLEMGMVLWCASMAFGAIHLSAWNEDFPSSIEAWLWHSSALWIASSGLLWLSINLIARLCPSINAFWDRCVALRAHWLCYLILGIACSICGLTYAAARLFLVIEAFVSIRALPPAAYDTPDWTEIFPHM
ncbi:MAG: hypothetical protein Q9164_004067 [Protoblastenia rupestris]